MTIFIVCRVQDPVKMKKSIQDNFPNDHIYLEHNEWLISTNGTAKELSDKLGITNIVAGIPTIVGTAIIFSVENYFGRAPTNIWEWIKTKAEALNG